MLLRLVRKISEKDAERLRTAKAKEKLIFNLKDAGFLLEDLEPYWAKIAKVFGKEGENLQTLGSFPQPKYGLQEEDSKIFYQRLKQQKAFKMLDLSYGTFNSGVFIKVREKLGRHILFELGPFFPKNRYENKFNWDGVIRDLAIYFYNRRSSYEALHEYFLKNKKGLSELFGQPFVEDLFLLFSVTSKKKVPNFKGVEKTTGVKILKKTGHNKNYAFVGFAHFYPKHFKPNRLDYYRLESVENELFLNSKNQLLIKAKTRQPTLIGEEEKLEFEAFVAKNLNTWLQQTIAVIDFGAAIYEKVKARIFVENI